MFGAKHLKTSWSEKTTEYQTNELSTKYSNWYAENILLWNVLKYNQVKLVLAVFAFIYSTLNHIDQARWN